MDTAGLEHKRRECTNCGAIVEVRYCPSCGQDAREPPTQLVPLLGVLASYASGIQGTAPRTLATLVFRPGRLTRDYVDGKRARYANPVQVYLWCTALFFLLHAYWPLVRLDPDTGVITSFLSTISINAHIAGVEEGATTLSPNFVTRFDGIVATTLPVLLVLLVAISVLLLWIMLRRANVLTHVVFALHWSSFYFVLETFRQIALRSLDSWGGLLALLGSIVMLLYLTVALRVAYSCSWLGGALRAIIGAVAFSTLAGVWLWATGELAERFA